MILLDVPLTISRRRRRTFRSDLRLEAHLTPSRKASVPIAVLKRRRSHVYWLAFWGMIVLNELRGLYVLQHIWAWFG